MWLFSLGGHHQVSRRNGSLLQRAAVEGATTRPSALGGPSRGGLTTKVKSFNNKCDKIKCKSFKCLFLLLQTDSTLVN